MLRQVAAMSEDERRVATQRPALHSNGDSPAPEALRELLAARQVLGNDREAVRKGVFRPSHNLPTRSLAEQVSHVREMLQKRVALNLRNVFHCAIKDVPCWLWPHLSQLAIISTLSCSLPTL